MFEVIKQEVIDEKVLGEVNNLISQLSLSATPPKPMSFDQLKEMLTQPKFNLLVVKSKDVIIGMIALHLSRIPTGLIAEIDDLIVDPPFRAWGIARLLVEKSIEVAEALGAKHISHRTNPKRLEANKLHQAIGFKIMEGNFYRINLPRNK